MARGISPALFLRKKPVTSRLEYAIFLLEPIVKGRGLAMNAFDTAHYIQLRQRRSAVFNPAFAGPLPEKREELGEGYAVQVRFYTAGAGKLPQYPI